MSYKSPLFTGALELYAQAVELYASKRQRNYKFAIMHLANAVELILKDALLDLGQSIYKHPKETIGIWDAFRLLDQHGVTVPRKPHIELLIDDRNTIQHRFGFPDDQPTFYYIDEVGKFLRQFLADRYGLNFGDEVPNYLDTKYLPLIGLAATPKAKITAMFELSPATAVVEAYRDLEGRLLSFTPGKEQELPPSLARKLLPRIIDALVKGKFLTDEGPQKFDQLAKARNAAAHGKPDQNWKQAIDLYLSFLPSLEEAAKNSFVYHSSPAEQIVGASEIGASFALSWIGRTAPDAIRESLSRAPALPKDLDAHLLKHASGVLGVEELDGPTRKALRAGFWKAIEASPPFGAAEPGASYGPAN